MKAWKKWILVALSLACICGIALGTASCDDESGDESSSVELSSSDSQEASDSTEDLTSDGSKAKPYHFTADEKGNMTVTLPASASHYYMVSRPNGRTFILVGEDVELQYTDLSGTAQTLTPVDGRIEVVLGDGSSENDREVVTLLLVNKKAEENELKLSLPIPAGSEYGVAFEATLDTQMIAKVKGTSTVYYTWTATAAGTLTISSTNANASLLLYNFGTYKQTGQGENSLAVNVGDEIKIEVSVSQVDSAATGETTDVPFTITLGS